MSANEKRCGTLPAVIALVAAALALAAAVFSYLGAAGGQATSRAEVVRESVAALEARGLWREAIAELDALRHEPGQTPAEQAEALYKMAMTADLNLNDCEHALGWYTQAKALNPKATWVAEDDKRSVTCMENTGRNDRAQALLNQLTGGPGTPGGTVVAVIDGHSVTWDQVQSALILATKPEDLAKPEYRSRMLQEYVFTSLLAAEAVKKGLDSEPTIQPAAEQARRQALAALYLRRELGDNPAQDAQSQLAAQLIQQHAVKIYNEAIPKP